MEDSIMIIDVQKDPTSSFVPPFCPNKACEYHTIDRDCLDNTHRWYTKRGFYSHKDGSRYQLYRCSCCGRVFSSTNFFTIYYQKKYIDLRLLMDLLVSGVSLRAMGRLLHCSPATSQHKLGIIARSSLAVLTDLMTHKKLKEDVVADGFESFAYSKYEPHDINLLAGKESQCCFFFNVAPFKRKGVMTKGQRQRCRVLYRHAKFEWGAITKRFEELAAQMARLYDWRERGMIPLHLYTDRKRQYVQALKKNERIRMLRDIGRFIHTQIDAKLYRDLRNDLFTVNYLDRELRKDMAEFRRKSTCFGRDVSAQMQRVSVYMCWHNIYKPYRINGGVKETHAQKAGVSERQVMEYRRRIDRGERYFLSRINGMPESWKKIWCDEIVTPLKTLEHNRIHGRYVAAYVFA